MPKTKKKSLDTKNKLRKLARAKKIEDLSANNLVNDKTKILKRDQVCLTKEKSREDEQHEQVRQHDKENDKVSMASNMQHSTTLPNAIGQARRRRVSFETRGLDDSVPPSPHTRRKNFNFTPISPGPESPSGIQSCSSTTASPFVSPPNTPVPRTKNNAHQNAGIMVEKTVKVKKEMSLDLSENFNQTCMAMSAPPSPMLQKLLNSKGSYKPNYMHMQSHNALSKVSQLLSNQLPNELNDLSYRSQSVPVNQMMFMPQNDFGEVESDTQVKQIIEALDTQCDNNNLNLLCNLEMSSKNQSLPEYGLHLVNNSLEISDYSNNGVSYDNLQNPSRSVPSTPLPLGQNFKPEMPRSYPSTPLANTSDNFTYQINNGDCLLNGQPIRSDDLSQHGSIDFVAAPSVAFTDMNGAENLTEFPDGSLLDDPCVLNYGP